jgi:hypothetical protein
MCQSKEAKEITDRIASCFSAVYFFFVGDGQSKKYQKETRWPAHGLARNFLTKLPPNNSLQSTGIA